MYDFRSKLNLKSDGINLFVISRQNLPKMLH